MLIVSPDLSIPDDEIVLTAVRAQGAGGQNVNKVATAIHLRFDTAASAALPDDIRERLVNLPDRRISSDGIVIIKAQRFRSQEKNRQDALSRLRILIQKALQPQKKRRPTKPGRRTEERRLQEKARRGRLKQSRGKVTDDPG